MATPGASCNTVAAPAPKDGTRGRGPKEEPACCLSEKGPQGKRKPGGPGGERPSPSALLESFP